MQLARICELGVIELRGMIDRKELVEHIPGSKNAGERKLVFDTSHKWASLKCTI